ncbi:MAG: family 16 glycoside hydrolase [Planctomycetota bacterium]
MKLKNISIIVTAIFLSWSQAGITQEPTSDQNPAVTVLAQLQKADAQSKNQILLSALSEDGKKIHEIIKVVKDRTLITGDYKEKEIIMIHDAAARIVISGFVMIAAAPENNDQSNSLATILSKSSAATHTEGVERFLTRMIGELGNPIGVAPLLASVVADENWSDESIRSMGAIAGKTSSAALLQILHDGPKRWSPAAASALALRGPDTSAIEGLTLALKDEDPQTAQAALESLVNLGSPNAMEPAIQQLLAAPKEEKGKHADLILQLAEKMEASRYEAYCINLLGALRLTKEVPESRREMAKKIRDRCLKWKPLFDGKSSTGWIGQTEGYHFSDNEIRCDAGTGGNIYTSEEFADFTLRFEFKLWPGSNNGLGLRTPAKGDAAFEGMEAQILDDSAEKYANLKPYQFHGSIYGVIPAIRGHQLPVGEWNFQEVRCQGRRVTITLNGHLILDADLDIASKNGTLDGAAHPGLKRTSGHIGFLGHGDAVAFRNLRILSLDKK